MLDLFRALLGIYANALKKTAHGIRNHTGRQAPGAPHLELAEVLWRYNLMVGALVYAMGGNDRMVRLPDLLESPPPAREVKDAEQIDYMVRFLAAGFAA